MFAFKTIRIAIAASGLALISAPAFAAPAAGQISLKGDVKVEKTVVTNGASTHVLVTPQKVVPGDRLVFSTAYHNNGASAVDHFVVTNPLPKGVAYAADGTEASEVSVDGGKSWGQLAKLTVADDKGGQRAAQANDVTHVRWTVAVIAPGATGAVSYHAVVR
ncbi:hypothetical protein [Novosphingobium sp.]|uniref:hypothetical protein n=1 Tax=Novosphingobium sp. TaxID=1874826 RepID=UPI0025DFF040|nr:hypothetical protein [Novosphingobium sp.]